MSARDDGGPAFPQGNDYIDHPNHGRMHRVQAGDIVEPGMSLRDYFAAKAIEGYCPGAMVSNDSVRLAAFNAYRVADAMLAQRKT